MAKKKPNIIECDGLVVRGRNGEKRAEISVDERHGHVTFELFGEEDDRNVPEPAFIAHVNSQGRAALGLCYAVSEEEEEEVGYVGGMRLNSGDFHTRPSFVVRGVHVELPERSSDEIAEEAAGAIAENLRELAARTRIDVEECRWVLDRAETLLREDESAQVTS